jgi:ubiquinone biosynthesis protein UbiJ
MKTDTSEPSVLPQLMDRVAHIERALESVFHRLERLETKLRTLYAADHPE